jgi:hypothetical protein
VISCQTCGVDFEPKRAKQDICNKCADRWELAHLRKILKPHMEGIEIENNSFIGVLGRILWERRAEGGRFAARRNPPRRYCSDCGKPIAVQADEDLIGPITRPGDDDILCWRKFTGGDLCVSKQEPPEPAAVEISSVEVAEIVIDGSQVRITANNGDTVAFDASIMVRVNHLLDRR